MEIPLYFTISTYASLAGSLIIGLSCLLHFSKRPGYIKLLGFYTLSSILFSLAQDVVPFFLKNSVNPIGNGFVLSEAVLLGLLFYFANESGFFKKVILYSLLFYVFWYALVFIFFIENSYSYIRLGRDLLMILYAIAYFYYLIRKLPEENLLAFPMFWINSAILFFFSGTFILSFFRDYIVFVLKDDMIGYWAFRNFFRFGFCLALSYGAWVDWRLIRKKEKNS